MSIRKIHIRLALFITSLPLSCQAADTPPENNVSTLEITEQFQTSISQRIKFAENKYIEHAIDGLWKKYPNEGQTVRTLINLAKKFQTKAIAFNNAGDKASAYGYLIATEATARCITEMPFHLNDMNNH